MSRNSHLHFQHRTLWLILLQQKLKAEKPKSKLCLRRQTQFIDDWFCTSWNQKWRSLKNTTFVQGTMRQWVHFAYVFTGTFPMGSSGSYSPRNTSCDSHTSYSDTEYSTECCEDNVLLPRPRALLVCMLAAQWPSISWKLTSQRCVPVTLPWWQQKTHSSTAICWTVQGMQHGRGAQPWERNRTVILWGWRGQQHLWRSPMRMREGNEKISEGLGTGPTSG